MDFEPTLLTPSPVLLPDMLYCFLGSQSQNSTPICTFYHDASLRLGSELHQWVSPTTLTCVTRRISQEWWCIISEVRLDPLLGRMRVCMLSHVWLFATPWTIVHQAPLSMRFPREEYWSRLPFPPPRNLPDPGIEPMFLVSPALAGGFLTTEPHEEPLGEY